VERPLDGGLGTAVHRRVGEALDEHRHPEHVGEQNELLPGGVAALPGVGQEPDAGRPLLPGEPDVLDERVSVTDERRENLPEPRVRGPGEALGNDVGRVLLVEHGGSLLFR
jgi:hypothetical protein